MEELITKVVLIGFTFALDFKATIMFQEEDAFWPRVVSYEFTFGRT
jgi:hypothetical protein